VYVRYVAEYHARHEVNKINELVSTGIIVVLGISFILLTIFYFTLPHLIINVFKISYHLQDTAFYLFYGTACIFMIEISMGGFLYMLNGMQRITETTIVALICISIETVLIIVFLLMGMGLYALMNALIIRYALMVVSYIVLSYRLIPGLSIGLKHFRRSYLRLFYRFGAIVQFTGMLSMTMNSMDKLVAASTLGTKETGLVDLGSRFPLTAVQIPGAMNAVMMPAVSYMHSQERKHEIYELYLRGTRSMSLITGFILGFLATFSELIVAAWLGKDPDLQIIAMIMTLTTFPQHMHILTGPGSAFFQGIEKPARTLTYSIGRLTLVTIALSSLFYFYPSPSLIQIVAVIALSTVLGALNYFRYINHFLSVGHWEYVKRALLPGFIPYLVGYLLVLILHNWIVFALDYRLYAIALTLASGLLYTVIVGLVLYFLVLDAKERGNLRRRILKAIVQLTSAGRKITKR
jgi:O-antigen/teichoic acid export membrane protein